MLRLSFSFHPDVANQSKVNSRHSSERRAAPDQLSHIGDDGNKQNQTKEAASSADKLNRVSQRAQPGHIEENMQCIEMNKDRRHVAPDLPRLQDLCG